MNDFANSGGHWYKPDGTPVYTIIGANGKERNTTLRDAKKHGYYPSVTSILNLLDKPGLNRWKMNQVMMAALTLPKIEGESLKDFESRAWGDSNKHSIEARDKGTEIHGAVERFFASGVVHSEYEEIACNVKGVLLECYGNQEWQPERSVSHPMGYGGKVDLHSQSVVIDYKTKDFDESNPPKGYDEQCMQLAAYRECINPNAECANIYISRNNPGLVHIHQWSDDELKKGFSMFTHLLEYWKLVKDHDGEIA